MQYTQTEELIVMLNMVSFHSKARSKKKLIEFSIGILLYAYGIFSFNVRP